MIRGLSLLRPSIFIMPPFRPLLAREVAALPAVRLLGLALAAFLFAADAAPLAAQSSAKRQRITFPGPADAPRRTRSVRVSAPADFRREHFLLHTDLAPREANELLDRLETMLTLIANYWNHPPVGIIEMYVVEDLSRWPDGSLEPEGLAKIKQRAGITVNETMTQGKRLLAAKSIVYAVSEHGTPQHEAVHAYCGQAFGHTGPLWYAEGMAEMGQYWRHGDTSVQCPPYVVDYLRASPIKPLADILAEDGGKQRRGGPQPVTGDSWQNYAWRWALCHLLANNTNYADRFRPLGLGLLSGQKVSFADTYGAMSDEVEFEYQFFLRHVEQGYRVDLCSWDWKRKFREPGAGMAVPSRISANRGWQPSGALVAAGKKYEYSATGNWQCGKDGEELSADGAPDGAGRLEGVVFKDFALGEPFALGAKGSFIALGDGRLFLRMHDGWNSLAENKGSVNVKIKKAASADSSEPTDGDGDAKPMQP
jgi:hypothetical protein